MLLVCLPAVLRIKASYDHTHNPTVHAFFHVPHPSQALRRSVVRLNSYFERMNTTLSLTQHVIREHLMGDARGPTLRAVVAALQAQMDTFDRDKAETYRACTCRAYTAHVRAALEHAGDTDASEDAARLAVAAGVFLEQATSAYAEALLLYERALAMRQGGGESYGLAQCYMGIGNVYERQGRYEEALVQYQKALEGFLALYGQEHATVAGSHVNIGNVYRAQGKYEEALVELKKGLDVLVTVYGLEHPEVAKRYGNIGNVLDYMGKPEEALVQHQRALEIQTRVFGSEHPLVAESFNNIGVVYLRLEKGDLENTLLQFQRALEIRTRVFGSEHQSVADSKYNLAVLHKKRRETEKARQLFLECEQIYSAVFGPDHSKTQGAARQASLCV